MDKLSVPIKKIGDRYWFLLNEFDDKCLFRSFKISEKRQSKEPSDHGSLEVEGKGSPKCSPKNQNWNISDFK